MAKKKSWFQLVKGFFISETKGKPQKKERRRKKWFSGHFKFRSLAVIEAPQPPKERTLVQAEHEHSKHALTVAIASAAAAEAAVVAAHAAAEVVRLTGVPPRNEMRMCDFAAIKIQTAFRGYLARKALRALRGLVRLQAMVRGRAVRRQVITSLNELQSLVKIQSRVREWRMKKAEHKKIDTENEVLVWKSKETKSNMNNKQTRCSDSLPSKEVCREIILSRQDSSIRRKHIKEYFLTHQETKTVDRLTETELENRNKRLDQYWFEHWVDESDKRDDEPPAFGSGLRPRGLVGYSSVSLPRRSFCQPKRYSSGDESFSRSPSVPNYMSATESAKAKARSYSTPKQRLENNSDNDSPSKNRLSFSSIGSDLSPTPVKNGKHPTCSQQISPRMRGLLGPIKSHKLSKDLSVDSECSLLTLERNNGFR